MKMSEVFEVNSFNVYHHAEIVDTSRYAYIEHNEIQIENSEYIDHAVQNHDRLVELEIDRENAISKMSKSWQHNASDHPDLLSRFVDMANRQFDENAELREALGWVHEKLIAEGKRYGASTKRAEISKLLNKTENTNE
ncbi:hypothetical protein SIPHO054v2_p0047 [Vibrio phage 103E44.1]|nr:hypothetical protein SIPHO054v2_p0047 [Vibrio phage 103E44.1]QZI87901.1 hypothetical protein SIPHO055v2_p0046 [Vibrio phage 104E43.1]